MLQQINRDISLDCQVRAEDCDGWCYLGMNSDYVQYVYQYVLSINYIKDNIV